MVKTKTNKIGFNGLTASEWARLSRSVWNDVSSPRKWYHLEHGATYSEAVAERVITLFSKKGDLVLDPFLGTGTTLVAAKKLGRRGLGIELYSKFVKIAKRVLSQTSLIKTEEQVVICDDCRNLLKYVQPNSVQLVMTSPPYANFIYKSVSDRKETHKTSAFVFDNRSVVKPYGTDERDFGNLSYEQFLNEIKELMKKLLIVTKPGGYNVWVVKDARDPQHGKPYIDFHSDLAKIAQEVGFLYHDLIIWDQNEQRKLVVLGFPSTFYVNINHTFLVVLRKPNHQS
ncbi:MAG: DNA methyltransferase [Conexivisphaerales archaeon]